MGEHPTDTWKRVCLKRVASVTHTLKLVGNCANRASGYEYTPLDVQKVFSDIWDAVRAAEGRYGIEPVNPLPTPDPVDTAPPERRADPIKHDGFMSEAESRVRWAIDKMNSGHTKEALDILHETIARHRERTK